mmetsp:Transcript_9554/g.28426  ORF Transcript_9554/g.28426 Transcript_9554/m.28426 type:complete len:266 (+) Transcript_9554:445-1242(+)
MPWRRRPASRTTVASFTSSATITAAFSAGSWRSLQCTATTCTASPRSPRHTRCPSRKRSSARTPMRSRWSRRSTSRCSVLTTLRRSTTTSGTWPSALPRGVTSASPSAMPPPSSSHCSGTPPCSFSTESSPCRRFSAPSRSSPSTRPRSRSLRCAASSARRCRGLRRASLRPTPSATSRCQRSSSAGPPTPRCCARGHTRSSRRITWWTHRTHTSRSEIAYVYDAISIRASAHWLSQSYVSSLPPTRPLISMHTSIRQHSHVYSM